MFRPTNSSESNLFTIRAALGYGSPLGAFNTLVNGAVIASNTTATPVTYNYLSSPSANNLPSGFNIVYTSATAVFTITYGKTFTSQPCINVSPISAVSGSFLAIPYVIKTSLTSCQVSFNNATVLVAPSTNGTSGLLGFDLLITGPIKIGATTGNSNKGWAMSDSTTADATCVYSSLDVNLGAAFTATDSVIVSKNLKLIGNDNTVKAYSASTGTLDYAQTVWTIGSGVALTTLTPQKGMVLIIIASAATSNPTVKTATSCYINYASNNTLTFTAAGDTAILYGVDTTRFIILSKATGVTLSTT